MTLSCLLDHLLPLNRKHGSLLPMLMHNRQSYLAASTLNLMLPFVQNRSTGENALIFFSFVYVLRRCEKLYRTLMSYSSLSLLRKEGGLPSVQGQVPSGRYPRFRERCPQFRERCPQFRGRYPRFRGRYPRSRGRYLQSSGRYPQSNERYSSSNGRHP